MSLTDKTTKMLILASDTFPPFRSDVNILFEKKLAGLGYRIDWILQSEQDCLTPYQTNLGSGRAWVAPTDNGCSRLQRLRKHWLKLKHDLLVFRLAFQNRYDFIQVKDAFIPALLAILAARMTEAKFVYWLSYPFPESDIYQALSGTARYRFIYLLRGTIFKFLLYRIIMPTASHVFVQSEQMKKDVSSMGIDYEKISAVPMGVEIENIPYEPRQETFCVSEESTKKKILYLGTLAKVRRLDFLIDVFAIVLKQFPNTILIFVGDGNDPSDRQFLEEKARQIGIEGHVVFTGFLPRAHAWEFVRRADVCVSFFYPTFILNSTSPTKLVEYMAMGKPVVANDHPEQSLMLAESKGGICVPCDKPAFVRALATILSDPALAIKMGENGRCYVATYRTYDIIAQAVHRQYSLLGGGQITNDELGPVNTI